MTTATQLVFSPFRLDPADEQVWRGSERIALRPKPFAVLCYLAERPGRLVTGDELRRAVWPDTAIGDDVLRGYVRDLRKALGDDVAAPRFIATVPRRGYRFVAATARVPPAPAVDAGRPSPDAQDDHAGFVGRDADLSRLLAWRDEALTGRRRVVFVTGEPGVGKTTLAEALLRVTGGPSSAWLARGQCLEQYGAGEPYGPVLEALARLVRESDAGTLRAVLARSAPTWLLQLPGVVDDAELAVLAQRTRGADRPRMLRELAEAVEILTADRLLVLVIEDLHWADSSTLDLITSLARRREPARLLLVATYRPAELIARPHPFAKVQQELQTHGQAHELPLACLTEAAVAEYLRSRFPGRRIPAGLPQAVWQRTDGNPLFVVNMVDYLLAQGLLAPAGTGLVTQAPLAELRAVVPESLRQMIERQLESLAADEQRTLEVGSVVGVEFAAAALADALGEGCGVVEERCQRLARLGHFVSASGTEEWPDGIVSPTYVFAHALYQAVLYGRVAPARRTELHRRIAQCLEARRGVHVGEGAAALAVHFERGHDHDRTVTWLGHAADQALRRYAYAEAIDHLTRALGVLARLPGGRARRQRELTLSAALATALMATRGYAAVEVQRVYARCRQLSGKLAPSAGVFPVVWGLWGFHSVRGDFRTADAMSQQLLAIARRARDDGLLIEAHYARAADAFWLGRPADARRWLDDAIARYDPSRHFALASSYAAQDPGVASYALRSWARWFLGDPDGALEDVGAAVALARRLDHPFSLAYARLFAAWIHKLRRETEAAREAAEAVIGLATQHGFPFWASTAAIVRGAALAEAGRVDAGIAEMRQALSALEAMGTGVARTCYLAWLAEAEARAGRVGSAIDLVDEALRTARRTSERIWEAELYRLKGGLVRARAEAERCLRRALEVARGQRALSLELRAAVALGRLWQDNGAGPRASRLLAATCARFPEALDTSDLRDARLARGLRARC